MPFGGLVHPASPFIEGFIHEVVKLGLLDGSDVFLRDFPSVFDGLVDPTFDIASRTGRFDTMVSRASKSAQFKSHLLRLVSGEDICVVDSVAGYSRKEGFISKEVIPSGGLGITAGFARLLVGSASPYSGFAAAIRPPIVLHHGVKSRYVLGVSIEIP